MKRGDKTWVVLTVTAVCCGAMLLVDGVWQPGYAVKSGVKIALFGALPVLLSKRVPSVDLRAIFRVKRGGGPDKSLLLGPALYALIVGGFFALRPFVDFSGIAGNLTATTGVSRANFLWVSLYISFVNSLLEEFFFRGFAFRGMKGKWGAKTACIVSALLFSLYHTAMMAGWFPFWLFLLALLGLGAGGCIFTALNKRSGTLYTSWLVHMCANFAINTVGFILL